MQIASPKSRSCRRVKAITVIPSPSSACALDTAGGFGPDRITRTLYDAAGRVYKVRTALNTALENDELTQLYTANGRTSSVIDGEDNLTHYTYDGHDRPARTYYPSATQGAGTFNAADYEQLGYDLASNVTTRRLRDGKVLGFSYDALNRLTYADNPDSSGGEVSDVDVTYVYDNIGQLLSATDSNGHYNVQTYDALGRLISQQSLYGGTKSMQYDLAGRRTRLTWPDAFYVTYSYLVTGEMYDLHENGSTAIASYRYDDLGRRTYLGRGNGTITTYTPDPVSRLSAMTQNYNGTTYDLTAGFTYNPASQIGTATRSNSVYSYTALTNGSTGYTNNGLNQVTAAGSVTPTYDARGNITSAPNVMGSGTSTYSYNLINQLATASGAPGFLYYEPLGNLSFIYDPVSGSQVFDYVGLELIQEFGAFGAINRRYVHGAGVDEPLVWYENGTRYYIHADERGSNIAISNDAGNLTDIHRYDEYGIPQAAIAGRFAYTGQTWLQDVGLYNYKARMYHPGLGRFMQTDPIGYWGGMNLYAYVTNDPVNFVDPLGLVPTPCWTDECDELVITALYRWRNEPPTPTGRAALLRSSPGGPDGDNRGPAEHVPTRPAFCNSTAYRAAGIAGRLGETLTGIGLVGAGVGAVTGVGAVAGLAVATGGGLLQGGASILQFAAGDDSAGARFVVGIIGGNSLRVLVPRNLRNEVIDAVAGSGVDTTLGRAIRDPCGR